MLTEALGRPVVRRRRPDSPSSRSVPPWPPGARRRPDRRRARPGAWARSGRRRPSRACSTRPRRETDGRGRPPPRADADAAGRSLASVVLAAVVAVAVSVPLPLDDAVGESVRGAVRDAFGAPEAALTVPPTGPGAGPRAVARRRRLPTVVARAAERRDAARVHRGACRSSAGRCRGRPAAVVLAAAGARRHRRARRPRRRRRGRRPSPTAVAATPGRRRAAAREHAGPADVRAHVRADGRIRPPSPTAEPSSEPTAEPTESTDAAGRAVLRGDARADRARPPRRRPRTGPRAAADRPAARNPPTGPPRMTAPPARGRDRPRLRRRRRRARRPARATSTPPCAPPTPRCGTGPTPTSRRARRRSSPPSSPIAGCSPAAWSCTAGSRAAVPPALADGRGGPARRWGRSTRRPPPSTAPDDDAPGLADAADALTARGVLASVAGDSSAALSLLSRAAAALAVCDRPGRPRRHARPRSGRWSPCTAASPSSPARCSTGRSPSTSAAPPHRRRHLLLRAWCALATGDGTAARALRARAGETGPEVVEPRDELVAVALDVALARRAGDVRGLLDLWARAREALVRHPVDLYVLLPVGELALAAARLGEQGWVAPHLEEGAALLDGPRRRRRCGARRGTGTACSTRSPPSSPTLAASHADALAAAARIEPPGRRPRPRRRGVAAGARRARSTPTRSPPRRRGCGPPGLGWDGVAPRRRGRAAHHRPPRDLGRSSPAPRDLESRRADDRRPRGRGADAAGSPSPSANGRSPPSSSRA